MNRSLPCLVLTASVLAFMSARAEWSTASVVNVGGVPRFAIDGKPMAATAVMPSPAGKPGEAAAQLKAFRDAGAMLSSDVWTMHDRRYNPRQWWLGEGEYDFALFDALAKGLVDAAPDGFIFPRIKIDPPRKWAEAHPGEMMGELYARPESEAWRALYRGMLKDVVAHVEASSYAGNVIGYHLGAFHCGEWLTGEWKEENRAYIPSVPCGEEDPLPPPAVTAVRRAAIRQRAEAVADVLVDAASCVKGLTGGRRLVGAFFGYPSIAHEKLSRVIRSGMVDFFAAPPVYFAVREPGRSGRSQAYYQASYRLHGRVYYEESDFRTFLSEPAFSPPNQTRRRPLDESLGIVRRSIGKCLAGGWENWWFLLGGNDTFAAPELMESIRVGAAEERDTLFTAQWKPAEVAVFTAADEYATSAGTHAPDFRLACKEDLHRDLLPACGVPFDSYELADIDDPRLPAYKVYFFPNAFSMDDARRAEIDGRVRRAGGTAIWTRCAADFFRTPAQLRKAFREAGAHVWTDTDDVIAVGRGYVMLHAASDGGKTVCLQGPCDVREVFGASPPLAGVSSISEWMKRGETRVWKVDERPCLAVVPLADHVRITAFDLMDQTDVHNELLVRREWTAQWNEGSFDIESCALDVYDPATDTGRVFLRFAPLPHARPARCADFAVDARARLVAVVSNGYPFAMREYSGGRVGRTRAFHALQRQARPYRPGRDGRILSNNWGGGYGDSRLDEAYALREIETGARLGVEVVELDDGWQKGRSSNSLLVKDRRKEGVWNGYWAFDPCFWDADPVRFSHGLAPLADAARAHGMEIGLWFGPDSSNDAANWERDADRLLAYFTSPGIRYFKIDSMKSFSPLALSRQRAMFDKVLAGSSTNVVFDLDVTAEIRPGYFGLPDIGTLFVENRYAKHCSWWPHQTLRNLWSLCEVVDPVRLRMEFLDPKQHAGLYAGRFPESPLRPELWSGDAVFATVMVSSPLAWMEMQGLAPETVAEMAPLVALWKRERDAMHAGDTFPVGAKPDGFSWTGFVTSASGGEGGWALLFRECSESASFSLDLSPYLLATSAEALAGGGKVRLEGSVLRVGIPRKLGYVWVRLK